MKKANKWKRPTPRKVGVHEDHWWEKSKVPSKALRKPKKKGSS